MTASTSLLAVTFTLAATMAIAQNIAPFRAERTVRVGRLTFAAPVANVFPLFTPLGELHWAPGWNPQVLYPADGHPVEGLLFRTNDHDGMFWWLTRYDPAHHVIEYHVVAPAAIARNIRVQCKPAGKATEVVVTDTYIGLTEPGNQFVRSLDEAAYARKMKVWEEPISQYLRDAK